MLLLLQLFSIKLKPPVYGGFFNCPIFEKIFNYVEENNKDTVVSCCNTVNRGMVFYPEQ